MLSRKLDYEAVVPPSPIAVMRPRLPTVDAILQYLRRIDETQIYTNYGPLWADFRKGLASYVNARSSEPGADATMTSNGTTAIELALRVRAKSGLRLCL